MTAIREEELNKINGGYMGETRMDSIYLAQAGMMKEDVTVAQLIFGWGTNSAKVREGWSKAGVTCETYFCSANHYYDGSGEITRKQALAKIGVTGQ